MNVNDATTILQNTELKQVKSKTVDKVILSFINMGILELYKRFDLWREQALITLTLGTTTYTLDGTDANVSMDLSDHTLLVVTQILDEDRTPQLLNDDRNESSLFTPVYNKVVTPEPDEDTDGTTLKVVYRAAPFFLVHQKQEIPLPPQFFEALFYYVGYRAHNSVKGDIKSENNVHYMRFDSSCQNIIFNGLTIVDEMQSIKFESRGYV